MRTAAAAAAGWKKFCHRCWLMTKQLIGKRTDVIHTVDACASSTVEELPDFAQSRDLKRLTLSHNLKLRALPESMGMLRALEQLRIAFFDCLATLPSSFGNLGALKTLHILHCDRLSCLPESFGNLSSLQHLEITNTPLLQSIVLTLWPAGQPPAAPSCTVARALQTLPESFGELTSLKRLEILRVQHCRRCQSSFGKLSSLQYLELACSQLQALPTSFGNLTALQQLHISSKKLRKLPETFNRLQGLIELTLDCLLLKVEASLSSNLPVLRMVIM